MPDKWVQYAQPVTSADKWAQYAQPAVPAGVPAGVTLGQPTAHPAVNMQPSTIGSVVGSVPGQLAIGAAKGAGSTLNSLGHLAVPDWAVNAAGGDANATNQRANALFKPSGTAQAIGKGVEQAGEFLIPGGAEEKVAAKLAPYVGKFLPVAKAGLAALGSGAVNSVQGGSFGTGAALGAVGSGIGQGLAKVAPSIAESALKIRKLDRAYDRTPGLAALEETSGFRPESVAESAQNRLGEINNQLERVVGNGGTSPVDLGSARSVITGAQNKAIAGNARGTYDQLIPMQNHLAEEFATGTPIPQMLNPPAALALKRGFGDEFIHNWNPETMQGTKATAAKVYRSLADELHSSVPGSRALDERASSLIPVAKRAESTALNAETGQRILGRVGAHTGALVGSALGGEEGYRRGGVAGGVAGAALGLATPELIANPAFQMFGARALYSPITGRILTPLATGGALQADRKVARFQ